jgi:hypothetical protein
LGRKLTPALLTRMWRRGWAVENASAKALTEAVESRSNGGPTATRWGAQPASARIPSATRAPPPTGSRHPRTTVAPRLASAVAVAHPSPEVHPVTRHVLPVRSTAPMRTSSTTESDIVEKLVPAQCSWDAVAPATAAAASAGTSRACRERCSVWIYDSETFSGAKDLRLLSLSQVRRRRRQPQPWTCTTQRDLTPFLDRSNLFGTL